MAKTVEATTLSRDELELMIADIRDAVVVADMILDAVFKMEVEKDGFGYAAGEHTYRLTEEQDRALVVSMQQVAGTSRKLEDAFSASAGAIA